MEKKDEIFKDILEMLKELLEYDNNPNNAYDLNATPCHVNRWIKMTLCTLAGEDKKEKVLMLLHILVGLVQVREVAYIFSDLDAHNTVEDIKCHCIYLYNAYWDELRQDVKEFIEAFKEE